MTTNHLEQNDSNKVADAANSTRQSLSESVFSNPQDFLKTIQDNFGKIANPNNDQISKSDLLLYSETGKDAKVAAAAKIAYDHYDDLQKMALHAGTASVDEDNNYSNITRSDLNLDVKLAAGSLTTEKIKDELYYATMSGVLAASTGMMGVLTGALAPDAPVLAVGAGIGTVAMAGLTVGYGYNAFKVGTDLEQASAKYKQMLGSWKEINGGK